jgi:hypothetical protein
LHQPQVCTGQRLVVWLDLIAALVQIVASMDVRSKDEQLTYCPASLAHGPDCLQTCFLRSNLGCAGPGSRDWVQTAKIDQSAVILTCLMIGSHR